MRQRVSTTRFGRRAGLAGAAAAAFARPALAQAPKPFRVGYVTISSSAQAPQVLAFTERLRELGWTDNKRLVVDVIALAGDTAGYGKAMRALVDLGADVLVAAGPEVALKEAIAASDRVPIVMSAFDYDPMARGYVKGLARPEGRVTGVYVQQIELAEKRAELATALLPGLRAANMVWDGPSRDQMQATVALAPRLGFEVATHEFTSRPYDYAAALDRLGGDRRLLLVPNSPSFFFDRETLGRLGLERRMPGIFAWRDWVVAGGLMSYGPRITDMNRRLADYVDRLARGARIADLPIEQPARIELAINLLTARAIGVEVPPTLLARADEVIE